MRARRRLRLGALVAIAILLAGMGWLFNSMADRYLTGTRQLPGSDWFGNPVPQNGPTPGYVWLGWARANQDPPGLRLEEPSDEGVAAGLRAGDILTHADGRALSAYGDLFRYYMESCRAGQSVIFGVQRGTRRFEVSIPLLPWLRSPADLGARYEQVAIRSGSGMMLRGWYLPPPQGGDGRAGVFAHGAKSSRFQGLRMAEHWLRHGFGLLLVDFSGRGESDGEHVTYGMNERKDVQAMLDWLRARPEVEPDKVVCFGTSNGAAAVLLAEAEQNQTAALALDAPFADLHAIGRETLRRSGYPELLAYPLELAVWLKSGLRVSRVRPVEAAARVRCPVLITHGTADDNVPPHHTREIVAARRGAGLPTEVWWIPEGEHGFDRYPPMDAYWDRVLGFYESIIGPPVPGGE